MGDDHHKPPPTKEEILQRIIDSFLTKITSSSREVARLFLEAHQWDVDAAASEFNDSVAARRNVQKPIDPRAQALYSDLGLDTPVSSPSSSPIRLRSPRSPRVERGEAIQQAVRDLEEQQQHLLNAAKESDDDFKRRLREINSVSPQEVTSIVTIWRNGLTLYDNPFWSFDDPQSSEFLQTIESLKSPRVLDSIDGKLRFLITLIRRQQEDFPEPFKPFQGVARTLAEPDSASTEPPPASPDSLTTEPTPSVDPTAPTTSIQLILADGARVASRFNTQQTIRDVRDFIDTAARPDGSRDYQLLNMMDFPPEPLTDLDQTIDQAGISNSVLTQKF